MSGSSWRRKTIRDQDLASPQMHLLRILNGHRLQQAQILRNPMANQPALLAEMSSNLSLVIWGIRTTGHQ